MANWSNPQLTSTYTNFLAEVKDRDVDLALQFDGTTSTNIPTNAIRWDSSANRWKKWSGSVWGELTATYALTALSLTGSITFEGATDDAYETTLTVVDPTADRTITLPNVTGTVVTTGDSGTVTSTMIADGTIVNADVNASAAIAGTKISPDFGAQTVTTTGVFSAALGTAGAPSITFTGDVNTGIYSPGADQVAISTGGTGRVFVDSAGKVGIGTSPSANLHVATTGNPEILIGGTQTPILSFIGGAGSDPVLGYAVGSLRIGTVTGVGATGFTEHLRVTATGDVNIKGAGTAGSTQAVSFSGSAPVDSLVVTSAGSVGVGTASPGTTVHALGGNVWSGSFYEVGRFQKTAGTAVSLGYDNAAYVATIGAYSHDGTASQLSFWTYPGSGSAQERMRLDASGNLGLGVTPSAWGFRTAFQNQLAALSGASGSSIMELTANQYVDVGATRRYIASAAATSYAQDSGAHYWHTAPSGTAGNPITFTQAMTLDASGRLLVGATSDSGGALLQVNGDRIRIATAKTPASATATGTTGEVCWDADYVYVCTATNTWKRAAIATW